MPADVVDAIATLRADWSYGSKPTYADFHRRAAAEVGFVSFMVDKGHCGTAARAFVATLSRTSAEASAG
eukprot:2777881-Heterocapsa_arctica.AAC.1